MHRLLIALLALAMHQSLSAQLVMQVEVNEPVEGLCNYKRVYALFGGFSGQVRPICPLSDAEMLELLNSLPFLKENPDYKGKGIVTFFISCEGRILDCHMDISTKNETLDEQIPDVYKRTGSWTPGTLNGEIVDCSEFRSFTIKKGKIAFKD